MATLRDSGMWSAIRATPSSGSVVRSAEPTRPRRAEALQVTRSTDSRMPRPVGRGIRSGQLNNVAVTDLETLLTNSRGMFERPHQLQPLVLPHPSHT